MIDRALKRPWTYQNQGLIIMIIMTHITELRRSHFLYSSHILILLIQRQPSKRRLNSSEFSILATMLFKFQSPWVTELILEQITLRIMIQRTTQPLNLWFRKAHSTLMQVCLPYSTRESRGASTNQVCQALQITVPKSALLVAAILRSEQGSHCEAKTGNKSFYRLPRQHYPNRQDNKHSLAHILWVGKVKRPYKGCRIKRHLRSCILTSFKCKVVSMSCNRNRLCLICLIETQKRAQEQRLQSWVTISVLQEVLVSPVIVFKTDKTNQAFFPLSGKRNYHHDIQVELMKPLTHFELAATIESIERVLNLDLTTQGRAVTLRILNIELLIGLPK